MDKENRSARSDGQTRYVLQIYNSTLQADVLRFRGREALSEPFSWEIDFTTGQARLPAQQLLMQYASFRMRSGKAVHGIITGFEWLSTSQDQSHHRVTGNNQQQEKIMDFFARMERVDAAVNRFYARRKAGIWSVISLPLLYLLGWTVWVMFWAPPAGGVTLIIHSKIDRPIRGFSVNGVAGGNAGAFDPDNKYAGENGATTCCGSIKGKTAEVIWTVDYTRAQYNAGLRTEIHKVIMPMPVRKRGENDLHVHFLPGNKVLLGWSDNAFSPYDPHSPHYQATVSLKDK